MNCVISMKMWFLFLSEVTGAVWVWVSNDYGSCYTCPFLPMLSVTTPRTTMLSLHWEKPHVISRLRYLSHSSALNYPMKCDLHVVLAWIFFHRVFTHFFFNILKIIILSVCGCFVCIYICVSYACLVLWVARIGCWTSAKKELQTVLNHHRNTGNWTWVLWNWRAASVCSRWVISSASLPGFVSLFFSPSSRIFIVCWRFAPNLLAIACIYCILKCQGFFVAHTRAKLAAVIHRLWLCHTPAICGVKSLGVITKTSQKQVTPGKVTMFSFWRRQSQRYRETLWPARLALHPSSGSGNHLIF